VKQEDLDKLLRFMHSYPRLVVLSGAGVSAGSGIPTYRDTSGTWQRSEPIQHGDFLRLPERRQRYWARSFFGWPLVRDARPNAVHTALAQLERLQRLELLITQNVDRLHQKAGSQEVVDLHGRLDRVVCLACGDKTSRDQVQEQLQHRNPQLHAPTVRPMPDGDADLPDDQISQLNVPECQRCTGTLMPDVVFFGGSVPRQRVNQGMQAIERADALVAVGTSLQVFSGFRFCRHAVASAKPLLLINPGSTRADTIATEKLACDSGELLQQVLAELA
jgi:NAD-dependent SIR2 family protein deacetylase